MTGEDNWLGGDLRIRATNLYPRNDVGSGLNLIVTPREFHILDEVFVVFHRLVQSEILEILSSQVGEWR